MNKIPHKVRAGIAVGLFIWAILAIIFTIIYAYYDYQLSIAITGPILAAVAFILSIIIMPKSEIDNSGSELQIKTTKKRSSYHQSKQKKPFITEKEWEELEEEEEEILAMEEVDDD